MVDVESRLEKLIEVFSDHPFAKPKGLFEKDTHIFSFDIFDGAEVEKAFAGQDWQSKVKDPYSMLGTFDEGLKFPRDFLVILNVDALLYYLPIFLSSIIIDPEEADVLIDSLISSFSSKSIFNRLSDAQKLFFNDVMAPFR